MYLPQIVHRGPDGMLHADMTGMAPEARASRAPAYPLFLPLRRGITREVSKRLSASTLRAMTALQIVALVDLRSGDPGGGGALRPDGGGFRRGRSGSGQPESRTDRRGATLGTLLREFLGHTRMSRLPVVAVAHWLRVLASARCSSPCSPRYGQLFDPTFALPLIGHWPVYEWAAELIAWLAGLGILALIVIRQQRPPAPRRGEHGRRSRFFGSTFWQAYYVEATILGVVVCVVAAARAGVRARRRRARAATRRRRPGCTSPSPRGSAALLRRSVRPALENAIVVVAAVKIVISMAWFVTIALQPTMGVAWHRFLAVRQHLVQAAPGRADGRTPSLGALQPIRVAGEPLDFEQTSRSSTRTPPLGVGKVEDFTWKGLLDFTTCTECGRCQSQCPAWNTDKPLSPKLLVMALRDHAYAKAPWLLAAEERPRTRLPGARASGRGPCGATGHAVTPRSARYNPLGAAA